MFWAARQDPDPVLILENVMLYNMTGKLSSEAGAVDIDKTAVRRAGNDVSLITYGGSLWKTLEAAAALTIKSVALAVHRFPLFDGLCRDGKFEPSSAAHIGAAIAIRGGGLAAPALHHVDRLSLDEPMARFRDLVQRMRSGRIRDSKISDPTITVSSLGERGVEAIFGIVYPPQVTLVGIGKVVEHPRSAPC